MDKDYVFLQHGITKDDLSSWLNTKKNMSLFVTATQDEYNSIRGNHSAYKFTDKEVILTGFPRHDALLAKNKLKKKILFLTDNNKRENFHPLAPKVRAKWEFM